MVVETMRLPTVQEVLSASSLPLLYGAEEFYRQAARLVEPLSWSQVHEIGGPDLTNLTARLRQAYNALQAEGVPAYLRLAAVRAAPYDANSRITTGYSSLDMLILATQVVDALPKFDGRRPTNEACREIATQAGVRLDRATVRRLVDFGILAVMPNVEEDHREH
jgi:hypothetical protein